MSEVLLDAGWVYLCGLLQGWFGEELLQQLQQLDLVPKIPTNDSQKKTRVYTVWEKI